MKHFMKIKFNLLAIVLCINSLNAQNPNSKNDFVVKPYLQIGVNPSPQRLQLLWQSNDTTAKWQVEQKTQESD